MRLHIDEDRSIATRHQPMERIESRVEGGGVPRHQTLPPVRALAGVLSASPEAVARAIEDLGQSGYRPLRPRPMAPDPASMRHAWDAEPTVMRVSPPR
jgi:DNA-binding transcriptional MocR family regulator